MLRFLLEMFALSCANIFLIRFFFKKNHCLLTSFNISSGDIYKFQKIYIIVFLRCIIVFFKENKVDFKVRYGGSSMLIWWLHGIGKIVEVTATLRNLSVDLFSFCWCLLLKKSLWFLISVGKCKSAYAVSWWNPFGWRGPK